MEPPFRHSIALLIDADNAPAAKIGFILSELASHGVVNIRRAYGNWTKSALNGWQKILHENSIQPIQLFDLVKGKNATDMTLLIDAMDLLYTKNVSTFCLVSSDCDFTPLIQRLRADGKDVFGFGGQTTPEPFIASCTRFIYLEETRIPDASKDGVATPVGTSNLQDKANLKGNTKLMNALRSSVQAFADEDGWANLSPVGSRFTTESSYSHRTFGFDRLVELFEAIDLFEVKRQKSENHTAIKIRLAKIGGKKIAVKGADDKSVQKPS